MVHPVTRPLAHPPTPGQPLSPQQTDLLIQSLRTVCRQNVELLRDGAHQGLAARQAAIDLQQRLNRALEELNQAQSRIAVLERNLTRTDQEKEELINLQAARGLQGQAQQGQIDPLTSFAILRRREEELRQEIAQLRQDLLQEQEDRLQVHHEYRETIAGIERAEAARADQRIFDEQRCQVLTSALRDMKCQYDTEGLKRIATASMIPLSTLPLGPIGPLVVGPIGWALRIMIPTGRQRLLKKEVQVIQGQLLEIHERLGKPPLDSQVFDLDKNVPI